MTVMREVSVESLEELWATFEYNTTCDPEEHCQCLFSDG